MADAPRVFLSYSYDSDEHADRVLALADALCDRGIDVILDRYVHPAPVEGWPHWMDRNLDEAKFVLMVCTETYRRRVMGLEEPGKGLGVRLEGSLISNRIYHDKPSGSRFIPILLPGSEPAHIPNPVQGHAYYRIATFDLTDPGFEALYRHLTDQPATSRPDLGALTILPPKPRPRPSPSPLSSGSPMINVPGATGPASSGLDDRIRAVLRPLMTTEQSRQARLTRAFHAYPGLLDRVATGGETGVFLSHLLQTLRDYGEVEAGRLALSVLLESVKDEVGVKDQQRIERIMQGLEHEPDRPDTQSNLTQLHSLPGQVIAMSQNASASVAPMVGILTALDHEFVAVKAMLDQPKDYDVPGANVRYVLGQIPSSNGGVHQVVLALGDMGESLAAIHGSEMLVRFPTVKSVLMVGIAGGVPNPSKRDDHVRLGDVVVSDRYGVVQYDYIKQTAEGVKFRSAPRPPSSRLLHYVRFLNVGAMEGRYPWEERLQEGLKKLNWARPADSSDFLGQTTDAREQVQHPNDPGRRPGQPRVLLGLIASSNTLLKEPTKRDALRDQFGAKAIEMETAGLADAAWIQEIGYLGVRGICDYCDGNKNDLWQPYAAMAAAAYVRALLESIPETANANP